ncbi:MAG: hypothetical protein Q9227_007785 [Pyrenula ochraceoflavens]
MANKGAVLAQNYEELLSNLLKHADEVKQGSHVDPALSEADLGERFRQLKNTITNDGSGPQASYAGLETFFRQEFYKAVAANSINEAGFVRTWNLLDTVQLFGDHGLCEPALLFWLVEELLDSQTIDGCRIVFDYLESRRERIIAKNFNSKNLVILRACNELLRRLSRAEDTVFCGRVFIFLFQSFPLGDKSSVNLRGEFHVENITTYDDIPIDGTAKNNDMSVEVAGSDPSTVPIAEAKSAGDGEQKEANKDALVMSEKGKPVDETQHLDLDALYPIFWSLQSWFSAPTRNLKEGRLSSLKTGLETTMASFLQVKSTVPTTGKHTDDAKRGVKRKSSDGESESTGTFHPKYLTSRDLFELEIHDLAFRRHILVQALIILDFLLSLTAAAKSKLAGLTNKSVLYAEYTLSEEDSAWAVKTKNSIVEYLQQGIGNEGKFYYRMVDTVLSRDKNWVRWKAENCPPIERPSVTAEEYLITQQNLKRKCTENGLTVSQNTMNMDFLSKDTSLDSLQDPERYRTPPSESFLKGIEMDELDAEMGTEDEMRAAMEAKDSKLWRALRASKNRFRLCEKIENGKNLKALAEENLDTVPIESAELEDPTQGRLQEGTTGNPAIAT